MLESPQGYCKMGLRVQAGQGGTAAAAWHCRCHPGACPCHLLLPSGPWQ